MVYDEFDSDFRTNDSFRERHNKGHHSIGVSPLQELENVDMVSDFILDYMHMICQGMWSNSEFFAKNKDVL